MSATARSTTTITLNTAASTTTTPTQTTTQVQIVTVTESSTSTIVSNVAEQTTVTPTRTTTTTVTETSTPVCAATPTCRAPSTAQKGFYTLYYKGKGVVESWNNPGNVANVETNFLDASTVCEAVSNCAALTYSDGYDSFDLHFRISRNQWECVHYYGRNRDGSYFNVQDADVSDAYGYSA